jgi:hypothetical protein
VLERWIPHDMLRGLEPFDPDSVVKSLSTRELERLIVDLDELRQQVQAPPKDNLYWKLTPLAPGELPAYVPPGPELERRMTRAAIFADRVLIPPPTLPVWQVGAPIFKQDVNPADLLRPAHATPARMSDEVEIPQFDVKVPRSRDDMYKIMDKWHEEAEAQYNRDVDRAKAELAEQLGEVARSLLKYWWTIRDAIADGWLNIVDRGLLISDNVRAIAGDLEFHAELERWNRTYGNISTTAWFNLMTATGLAHTFGRDHLVAFPADRETTHLIALTSRFYTSLPYGRVLLGRWMPTRRIVVDGVGEVERGNWFDKLIVGLGPAADLLDMQVAQELRQDGTAIAFRQWMTGDLNRVAFAATHGEDPEPVILECRHQLQEIAKAADARIRGSGSELMRRRLRQAGIWGASGLIAGFTGTLITGGPPAVAAGTAAVGFALSAAAGASGESGHANASPDPVIFDLMRHLDRARRRR